MPDQYIYIYTHIQELLRQIIHIYDKITTRLSSSGILIKKRLCTRMFLLWAQSSDGSIEKGAILLSQSRISATRKTEQEHIYF